MTHTTTVIEELRTRTATTRSTFVPFIRIRGRWLERAGIHAGDKLEITLTEAGELVIKKATAQQ